MGWNGMGRGDYERTDERGDRFRTGLTQGCELWYLTSLTLTPASSHTSRLTDSSMLSPGSTNPARQLKKPFGHAFWRPRRSLSLLAFCTAMITTGSVRAMMDKEGD